jgi:hypothetical protein
MNECKSILRLKSQAQRDLEVISQEQDHTSVQKFVTIYYYYKLCNLQALEQHAVGQVFRKSKNKSAIQFIKSCVTPFDHIPNSQTDGTKARRHAHNAILCNARLSNTVAQRGTIPKKTISSISYCFFFIPFVLYWLCLLNVVEILDSLLFDPE